MANLAEFIVNDKVVQEPRGKFKSNNNTVGLLLDWNVEMLYRSDLGKTNKSR